MQFRVSFADAIRLLALFVLTAAVAMGPRSPEACERGLSAPAGTLAACKPADRVTHVPDGPPQMPRTEVREPYPNPARGQATTTYSLARASAVQIDLYDAVGRHVRRLVDGVQPVGSYEVIWNGTDEHGANVTPGIYLACLRLGTETATRKLVLIR